MSETTTTVKKVEVTPSELNDLLDIPGANNVLLPGEDEKPSFFSKGTQDLSFLTKKPTVKKVETPTEAISTSTENTESTENTQNTEASSFTEVLEEVNPTETQEESDKKKTGAPRISKDAAIELTKKLIEKGTIVPFDDDKKIEDYTTADFEELYEANLKDKEEKIKAEIPVEFFDSLPEELQYAAKYVADGGKDLKGLFKALSQMEEVRSLSEDVPEDQETIVREYLTVTNFGTPEDITEEISSWKDLNKLEEKAAKFKPKLDKMRADQISQRLAHQEGLRKQRQDAAVKYQNSVYETLKAGELNGIKLDKKTQGMLFSGLTQSQYSSVHGQPTNLFGHLLEKYQFVEPNHALIAEVLWHLEDPEGFKAKIKDLSKTETTEQIVKKLKTEESRKLASSSSTERDEQTSNQRKLPRNNNFFKR